MHRYSRKKAVLGDFGPRYDVLKHPRQVDVVCGCQTEPADSDGPASSRKAVSLAAPLPDSSGLLVVARLTKEDDLLCRELATGENGATPQNVYMAPPICGVPNRKNPFCLLIFFVAGFRKMSLDREIWNVICVVEH